MLIDSCCLQNVQYDAIKHICTFLSVAVRFNIYGCELFYDLCLSVRVRRHGGKWYKNFTMLCLMTSPPHSVGTLVTRYTTLHTATPAHFGLGRTVLDWSSNALLSSLLTFVQHDECGGWPEVWLCVLAVSGSGNAAQLRRVLS